MMEGVCCKVSSVADVEGALLRIKSGNTEAVATTVSGREDDLDLPALTQAHLNLSLKKGCLVGFVVGCLIGAAMWIYMAAPVINAWLEPLILIVACGFGWSLFGIIVGSSGLFVKSPEHARSARRHALR